MLSLANATGRMPSTAPGCAYALTCHTSALSTSMPADPVLDLLRLRVQA